MVFPAVNGARSAGVQGSQVGDAGAIAGAPPPPSAQQPPAAVNGPALSVASGQGGAPASAAQRSEAAGVAAQSARRANAQAALAAFGSIPRPAADPVPAGAEEGAGATARRAGSCARHTIGEALQPRAIAGRLYGGAASLAGAFLPHVPGAHLGFEALTTSVRNGIVGRPASAAENARQAAAMAANTVIPGFGTVAENSYGQWEGAYEIAQCTSEADRHAAEQREGAAVRSRTEGQSAMSNYNPALPHGGVDVERMRNDRSYYDGVMTQARQNAR